jgi:DNA modification methylase
MWSWLYDVVEASGYPVRNMIVWDKGQMGMGFPWRAQHELIVFAKKTAAQMGDGKCGNVLTAKRTGNVNHPTEKPVELLKAILDNTPGRIYDPFVGSGTTIIAAETTGRVCVAIDIDPGYVDVAVKRWQTFTGREAVLDGDGRTFNELSALRASEPMASAAG